MLKQQKKKKKKKDDEFFKLVLKFREIDSAAIEQNRQENIIDLFDYLDDKSQVTDDELKTEDIFIDDDDLIDSLNEQEIKE